MQPFLEISLEDWDAVLATDGITVNTVAPGGIDTVRDWSQYKHQAKEQIEKEIPLGRFGDVKEVAAACCFLAGDGGHYMY